MNSFPGLFPHTNVAPFVLKISESMFTFSDLKVASLDPLALFAFGEQEPVPLNLQEAL